MEQTTPTIPPGERHFDGVSAIDLCDAARDATPAEIAAARQDLAAWVDERAARRAWTRTQWASEYDRLDVEADRGPVQRVWAELARLTCRAPAPRVEEITDALRAMPSYVPPPPEDEPDDDESDAEPSPPALVERLRYLLTLRDDDPISGRRVRMIRAGMEAVRPAGPEPPGPSSSVPTPSPACDDPVLPDRREHLRRRIEELRARDPRFASVWDACPTTTDGAGAASAMLARLQNFGFTHKEQQCAVRILRGVPEPYDPSGPLRHFPYTDTGNAERIVARHGQTIRYCHPQRRWYVYDGRRWIPRMNGAR